jgi:hypothetical protein
MSIVTNPSAVGLLKEFSHMDQKYYPENMRTMMLQNTGWTFGTLYSVIRPLLDVRVQKKIQIMGTGAKLAETMEPWIDMSSVPEGFGGTAEDSEPPAALQVAHLPMGTAPVRPGEEAVPLEFSTDSVDEHAGDRHDDDAAAAGDGSRPATPAPLAPPPPPPPKPVVKRKVTEFLLHRGKTEEGVPATTAFVLGWPVVQRCGRLFVDARGAAVAEIVRDREGGLIIVDKDRLIRYRVVAPRFASMRKSKLHVFRPHQPDARVESALSGGAAVPTDMYLSMEVGVAGSGVDARDWCCVSHTRQDAPLLTRRASHVAFRKELLSVPIATLFALSAAICDRWPWETSL